MRSILTILLAAVLAFSQNRLFCQDIPEETNKTVLLAILARNKAHTLPYYLRCLDNLDYDKKSITVYINTNNNDDDTETILRNWAKRNEDTYNKIIFESHHVDSLSSENPHAWHGARFRALGAIRQQSMLKTKEYGLDYYFVVDCDNFIAPETLRVLVQEDKPIIAPMLLAKPKLGDSYSNYFCDIDPVGLYKDHEDYYKILLKQKTGSFKVPVVHCTYLVNAEHIDKLRYVDGTDMWEFVIFSTSARNSGVDQYICNKQDFGFLLHPPENITLAEEAALVKQLFNQEVPIAQ